MKIYLIKWLDPTTHLMKNKDEDIDMSECVSVGQLEIKGQRAYIKHNWYKDGQCDVTVIHKDLIKSKELIYDQSKTVVAKRKRA